MLAWRPKVSDSAYREWVQVFERALAAPEFARLREQHGFYPLSLTGPALQQFITTSMASYRTLAAEFQLSKR